MVSVGGWSTGAAGGPIGLTGAAGFWFIFVGHQYGSSPTGTILGLERTSECKDSSMLTDLFLKHSLLSSQEADGNVVTPAGTPYTGGDSAGLCFTNNNKITILNT